LRSRTFSLIFLSLIGGIFLASPIPAQTGDINKMRQAVYDGVFPPALPQKYSYEIQVKPYFENYSFTDDETTGVALFALARGPRRLSIYAEAMYQKKFGKKEAFFSGGRNL
jgi:hypothetical protein